MNRTEHPLYKTWAMMKTRCYNSKHKSYKYYGAKGITICESWLLDFWNFANDMGERPINHTLDRIDSSLNYCKENCRWATALLQVLNRDSQRNAKGYKQRGPNKFVAFCRIAGKPRSKTFKTQDEALNWYHSNRKTALPSLKS